LSQHRSPHRTHTPDGLVCTGLTPRELCKRSLHRTLTRTHPSSHRTRPVCTGRELREFHRESDLTGRSTPDSMRKLFPRPVPQLGRVRPHTGRVRLDSTARNELQLLPLLPCANTKVSQHLCKCVSIFTNIFARELASQLATPLDSNTYAKLDRSSGTR